MLLWGESMAVRKKLQRIAVISAYALLLVVALPRRTD
jgi:hypothetical protein